MMNEGDDHMDKISNDIGVFLEAYHLWIADVSHVVLSSYKAKVFNLGTESLRLRLMRGMTGDLIDD